jgi:IS30 family transposase
LSSDKTLFVESRGALARELRAHRRSGRPLRRSVHNTTSGQWRSQIKGAVSIRERPLEVEVRTVPGHFDVDPLLGRHWTQVATLVARTTRFPVLVQLDGRDMQAVTDRLSREIARPPAHVRRSLTWDRGMELAKRLVVTANTGLQIYFVIRAVCGNAAPTRIRIGCCGSTSRGACR